MCFPFLGGTSSISSKYAGSLAARLCCAARTRPVTMFRVPVDFKDLRKGIDDVARNPDFMEKSQA